MNFFNKKEELSGKEKKEQIEQERYDLKVEIATKLFEKEYSEEDINSVLEIIEIAEVEIEEIKASLIGTNINPQGDPMKPLSDGISKIKERQLKLQRDLAFKIQELSLKYQK